MKIKCHILFSLVAAIFFVAPATLAAQDSTHFITVGRGAPKAGLLERLDGKLAFAPHYSPEMGLGTAFAYTSGANISLIGNVSTGGYVLLGINGAHYMASEKWQIAYDAIYSFLPSYYWGAGYEDGSYYGNRSGYDKRLFRTGVRLMRIFTKHFQAGPTLGYEWVEWSNFPSGSPVVSKGFRYGAAAIYDSRNSSNNPSGGIYLHLRQSNYTDFRGKPHFATDFTFDWYKGVWDGGILAFDLHSQFTYGDVPYTMLPTIGGAYRMRGYYPGRYRDNNTVSAQLELRQHICGMFGMALWGGGANVWGKYCRFDIGHTLPNYGAGIRWNIGGNTTLRFDLGFGKKGQNAFIFSVNEAF